MPDAVRAVIVGNSGSGKTWLARRIATADVEVVHLDELFWMPGGFERRRSEDELARLVARTLERSEWVVEGVFGDLARRYLDSAGTLIWLDTPWELCRARLERRGVDGVERHGRRQTDEGLRALLEWASRYHERVGPTSRGGHRALFDAFAGTKVKLSSELDVARYIDAR